MGENEFRIVEVKSEPISRVPREQAIGTVRQYRGCDGFVALISDAVIERLCALSHNSEPNEWLGILVGRVGEDDRGAYVVVDGVILDQNAIATPGSVLSTFEGERRVREIAAAAYCGSTIIGWAHSHYRCGTRFSSGDRDNQATWPAAHALGIVCDPATRERIGVYRGPKSERLAQVRSSEPALSSITGQSVSTVHVLSSHITRDKHSYGETLDGSEATEEIQPNPSGMNWSAILADIAGVALIVLAWHLWTKVSDMHARLDVLERTVQSLDDQCQARPVLESSRERSKSSVHSGDENTNAHFVQPAP